MLKGFKEFLMRGNIVDLAVAVVIGTAFTKLVTDFTSSVIEPLISRIGAGPNSEYGVLKIPLGGDPATFIDLNVFVTGIINFVLVAMVVYFLVVLPYNTWRNRKGATKPDATEAELLTEIRDLLAQQKTEGR